METLKIAGHELRLATRNWRMRVAVAAILIIPLLYGALYLWAFWDPYGRLDTLPVALVNEDRPAVSGDTTITAGDDLADELLDDGTLDWHVVSQATAREGLKKGTYYLELHIPDNFSAQLATADSDDPVPAQLVLTTHESANMIANQIGERVVGEVRAAASESASDQYYDSIFVAFGDVYDGFMDAADGAGDLHDGLADAKSGAEDIDAGAETARSGAAELASGSAKLSKGAHKLRSGASDLASGTKDLSAGLATARSGASDLADGTKDLSAGLATAKSGASDLASGTKATASGAAELAEGVSGIDTGAERLASSAHDLSDGADRLDTGVSSAASKVSSAKDAAASLKQGAAGVVSLLEAYAAANPSAQSDATFQQALGTAKAVSGGASDLNDGMSSAVSQFGDLTDGADDLATGAGKLADGADSLAGATGQAAEGADAIAGAADQLASGSASLATGVGTAASGAQKISSGSASLASGVGAAASGAREVSSGSATLASGAKKLDRGLADATTGAGDLASGLGDLSDGTSDLASGLGDAVAGSRELRNGLTAGAADVPDYSEAERTGHADMMSDPVRLETGRLDAVQNYGTGFSPYFIPLALWIGSLMLFFVVRPVPPDAIERGLDPVRAALSGLWPAALLAVAQSAILLTVLHRGLGLEARSLPLLYAYGALAAVVFAAILQWLCSYGLPGKFIAVILLMLQLTSAAGTYPYETLPRFFQVINPWLPMTYVVAGLRQIISGGEWGLLAGDAWRLAAFGVAAVALMSLRAWRARDWPSEKLNVLPEV